MNRAYQNGFPFENAHTLPQVSIGSLSITFRIEQNIPVLVACIFTIREFGRAIFKKVYHLLNKEIIVNLNINKNIHETVYKLLYNQNVFVKLSLSEIAFLGVKQYILGNSTQLFHRLWCQQYQLSLLKSKYMEGSANSLCKEDFNVLT